MKTIAIASLCSLLSFLPALAADGWMTDFEAAKKKAAKENKSLLIDFTGSDWCPPCIKLKEDVLGTEVFSKEAVNHYVLVELDYPRDKSKMSEETIAQNDQLVKAYEIEGFPTLVLADATGRPFAQTGFQPGGPEDYLKHLAGLHEKLAARDKAYAELKKAKGKARGAALEALLASVPQQSVSKFYGKEIAELSKVSPKSELVVALAKAEAEAKQEEKFNGLFQAGDFDGVLALVDKIAKEQKLEGLELQKLYVYKVNAYAMEEKFMKAVEVLDQVTAIDPESDYGTGAQRYKESLLAKVAEEKNAEQVAKEEPKQAKPSKGKPMPSKAAEKKGEVKPAPAKAAQKKGEAKAEKKPGGAVSPAVKLEVPDDKAVADAKAKAGKNGRQGRRGAGKPDPARGAKALPGKSEEDLRQGLERARNAHKGAVNRVNNTDAMMAKLGKDAATREQEAKKLSAAAEKAKAAVAEAKKKHGVLEKEHDAAHQQEESLRKMIAAFETELNKRGQVAELEKQAEELRKKAEALRKKAEKLKE